MYSRRPCASVPRPRHCAELAVAAAIAIKLPALFGMPLDDDYAGFYARNLGLFVLPLLTGYFAWKRLLDAATLGRLAGAFFAAAVFANAYPFVPASHTELLTALHLPVARRAIAARLGEFGISPNRLAGLGLNLVLLVNLAWSAVLYLRFLRGQVSFAALERWQTGYLPVYAGWAAIVVVAFPPLFGYR